MVIRRSIRLSCDVPPGREDEKVCEWSTRLAAFRGENAEDGRVDMILADGTYVDEVCEIILVRNVVPVPGDDVERAMRLGGLPELTKQLGNTLDLVTKKLP